MRVLTANRNWQRLAAQAREFDADTAVIADERYYGQLRDALAGTDVKVYAGEDAVAQVAAGGDTDVVVNALVGYAGLAPTVAALGAGKKLALANKESLVVGGEYVMRLAAEKACADPADRLGAFGHLPVSGGRAGPRTAAHNHVQRRRIPRPAVRKAGRRDRGAGAAPPPVGDGREDHDRLLDAGEQGFEVIEAHWLFGTPVEKISVLLHPQSIVHSMVEFEDGAIKAQLGTPDMRMPISLALMYPGGRPAPASGSTSWRIRS